MDAPEQVKAIARFWGGQGAERTVVELEEGRWAFRCADPEDGFRYQVEAPGVPHAVFEDSGRPSGTATLPDSWHVRCVNDAPDATWEVDAQGVYHGWRGTTQLPGWPE